MQVTTINNTAQTFTNYTLFIYLFSEIRKVVKMYARQLS